MRPSRRVARRPRCAGRRGHREPLAWLCVFLFTFLPVSNLVVVSGIVMAERALYLPLLALSGLAAAAVPGLLARHRGLALLPLAAVEPWQPRAFEPASQLPGTVPFR